VNKFMLQDGDRKRAVARAAAKRLGRYSIEGELVTDAQIAERVGCTEIAAQGRRIKAAKLDGPITWARLGLRP